MQPGKANFGHASGLVASEFTELLMHYQQHRSLLLLDYFCKSVAGHASTF